MCGLSAHDATAYNALGVLHGNAALAALDVDYEAHDGHHDSDQYGNPQGRTRSPGTRLNFQIKLVDTAGQADHDTRKNQERHAIANATFGNLFAQPHDECCTGCEREHGHDDEARAWIDDKITLPLEADGDKQRLNATEDDGQVSRPLGNLASAKLSLFLQFSQRLVDHSQQLQNDGRRDVGHDAQGEDRQLACVATAEHVNKAEEGTATPLKQRGQFVGVDARRGHVRSQAVDGQEAEREEHTLAQVRDAENVRQLIEQVRHGSHYAKTSNLPPAPVIFSCADLENL